MPISSHELKHFLRNTFVETGCAALGWGVKSALIAGFKKIYTVDINPESVEKCKEIFAGDDRVQVDLGDCATWLEEILNQINEPCTVYLDANGWVDETESPFHSSIEALVRHGREDHIILVDDMNHGKEPYEKLMKELRAPGSEIIQLLRRINPDYVFYLIDTHLEDMSHVFPSWVLVAEPHKGRVIGKTIDYV